MEPWKDVLEALVPFLLAAAFLILIVSAINIVGKKVDKHDQWLHQLDLRLGNLHKDKQKAYVQSLQVRRPGEPPPLSEEKTLEISEDMLETMIRQTRKDGSDDRKE